MTSIGAACASLGSGFFAGQSKLKMILLINLLVIISSSITLVDNIWVILVGRTLFGASAGAFTVYCPKFIAETAPTEYRGPFGTMSQFMCTFGIVIPSALSLIIPNGDELLLHQDDFICT